MSGLTASSLCAAQALIKELEGHDKSRILGIGVDICAVDRMRKALTRRGFKLVQHLLRPEEVTEFQARYARNAERGVHFLATRFAAKEALAKALGTGVRGAMTWQNASVIHDSTPANRGRPIWQLHGQLAQLAVLSGWAAHLSISDESQNVVAFVLVEQR